MWGWLSGNWDFAPPLWSGLLQDAEGGSLVKTGHIGLRKVHVSSLCCWFLVEAVRSAASRFQLLCFPFRHLKYSYMWSGRHGCLLLSVRLSVITSILFIFYQNNGENLILVNLGVEETGVVCRQGFCLPAFLFFLFLLLLFFLCFLKHCEGTILMNSLYWFIYFVGSVSCRWQELLEKMRTGEILLKRETIMALLVF